MARRVERSAQIETEARRLARSGIYMGFRAIARRLVEQGYKEAPKLFENRWTQQELNRLCYTSRPSLATQPSCPVMERVSHSGDAKSQA